MMPAEKIIFIRKVFVLFYLFASISSGFAQEKKLQFTGNKIIACTEAGQIPYEMTDMNGNLYGFEIDMMKEFSQFEGKPLEIIDTKWDGIFPTLYAHICDMVIAAIGITAERAKKIDFSDPIIEDGVFAMTYKDNPKFIEEQPDIYHYDKNNVSIALPFSTISDLTAQKFIKHAKILKYENNTDSFQAFYSKKTDIFINHKSYIQTMNALYPGKFKLFKDNIFTMHLGAAFRKDDAALKNDFNLFLKEWHKKPESKLDYKKYLIY